MNKISSSDAFSLLEKWREDGAILQFGYRDMRTGEYRPWWVLVSKIISGGSPAAILSILSDPFPFFRVLLKDAKHLYGDHREFSEDERLAKLAEHSWVCFLALEMPSGNILMLSEVRRDFLPTDLEN